MAALLMALMVSGQNATRTKCHYDKMPREKSLLGQNAANK